MRGSLALALGVGLILGCSGGGDMPSMPSLPSMKSLPSIGSSGGPAEMPDCSSEGLIGPPRGCVTGVLRCGDTVQGNTTGGESNWDDKFYAGAFCFPAGDTHPGPERVYTFESPENTQITVKLKSSCVDLDLAVLTWEYEGTCPTERHLLSECEADNRRGGGEVVVQNFKPRSYLVAVDGKRGEVGPYTLSVECQPLRTQEERSANPFR